MALVEQCLRVQTGGLVSHRCEEVAGLHERTFGGCVIECVQAPTVAEERVRALAYMPKPPPASRGCSPGTSLPQLAQTPTYRV